MEAEEEYERVERVFLDAVAHGTSPAGLAELVENVASAAERWNTESYQAFHRSAGDERARLDITTDQTELLAGLWRDLAAAFAQGYPR